MFKRIVCAAIRNEAGNIICGARHFDDTMHRHIAMLGAEAIADWYNPDARVEQGFIDQSGVFYLRREAWAIAAKAGQIRCRCGGYVKDGGTLYSENLY